MTGIASPWVSPVLPRSRMTTLLVALAASWSMLMPAGSLAADPNPGNGFLGEATSGGPTALPALALPSGFAESTAFSGLTNPTVVQFSSDGRVFVAEKSGIIKVFDNLSDTLNGSVNNTATVSSTTPDLNTGNNSSTVNVKLRP